MKLPISCNCGSNDFSYSSNPLYNVFLKCQKCGNLKLLIKYMPYQLSELLANKVVVMPKNRIPKMNEREEAEIRKLQHEKGLNFWEAYDRVKQGTLDQFF